MALNRADVAPVLHIRYCQVTPFADASTRSFGKLRNTIQWIVQAFFFFPQSVFHAEPPRCVMTATLPICKKRSSWLTKSLDRKIHRSMHTLKWRRSRRKPSQMAKWSNRIASRDYCALRRGMWSIADLFPAQAKDSAWHCRWRRRLWRCAWHESTDASKIVYNSEQCGRFGSSIHVMDLK